MTTFSGSVLIAAARHVEAHGNMHPAAAIAAVTQDAWLFETAWRELVDACGMDYMDFGADEIIDSLVAAAYWGDS